jgi:hypothetical protein
LRRIPSTTSPSIRRPRMLFKSEKKSPMVV